MVAWMAICCSLLEMHHEASLRETTGTQAMDQSAWEGGHLIWGLETLDNKQSHTMVLLDKHQTRTRTLLCNSWCCHL